MGYTKMARGLKTMRSSSTQMATATRAALKDGKCHGVNAKFVFANCDRYEGPFKNGKKHLENAKYFFANCDRYEGPFKDGNMHGEVRSSSTQMATATMGSCKDDEKHGENARFRFASGDSYE